MPHYVRYRTFEKDCEEKIETENGGTKRCGVVFQTTNPARKYCDEHKAAKPWSKPAIKRL